MISSDTYEFALYNNVRTLSQKESSSANSCQLDHSSFIAEFYIEQQREINRLYKLEKELLDRAASIRQKMASLESIPEKYKEWHQCDIALNQVEAKLLQVTQQMNESTVI